MDEKETITVISLTNNEIVRESNEFVFSNAGLSEIQMNMFFRGITKFDLDPESIDIERRYMVEFQRSEIPRIDRKNKIIEELEALQDIRVKRVLPNGGWERLIPFPKIGKYENGSIKIWFDGEYLKPILERKRGYAVFHIAEMFSLSGGHPKKLFEIFSSYKNRDIKRFDIAISTLKDILGIPDKYKDNHGMLMKMVIIPALEQINEKTSISVEAAYRQRKGRTAASIIFDIERKQQTPDQLPEQEQAAPKGLETPLTEKQKRCFDWLLGCDFTKSQAQNCADSPETLDIFYKWKYHNSIDSELAKGSFDRKAAQKMFFVELKKNNLKI